MATATFFLLIIPMVCFTTLTRGQLPIPGGAVVSEIQALMSFKLNLRDPLGALNGWDSSTPSAPCDWRGVVCSNDNQVRQLSLPRLHLAGRLSDQLANLRDLRRLNLHSNNFNGSIPPSLPMRSATRRILARQLALRRPPAGHFQPHQPPNPQPRSQLPLRHNLRRHSGQPSLQLVNFSFNQFTGGVPPTIGHLQMLEYLWLDSNRLTGTLPSAISNCSSLVHFSADDNALRGLIPATIGAIPKLQVVSLARNGLSGSVPISLLCNVNVDSSLRIVDLGFNALTGIVEPQNARCSSILEVLVLKSNRIGRSFPNWLTNVTTLRVLDVSGNLFSGELPAEIGNLLRLEELRVADNSLSGEIPSEIAKCSLLQALDLGGNRFGGQFPPFLGGMRSLKVLALGGNLISGTIPSSLGALSGLESLNLSGNNLTGEVPVELMQLSNLTSLNLSNNKFSGEVLGNVGALRSLQVLNLSNCGFLASIPASIGSLMRLATLDLSRQELSGELPNEIFGLPNLQVVALQENQLSGDVPQGFSLSSLLYLNLSSNAFTGVIPATYGFLQSLTVLSLSENRISGVIPPELGDSLNLQVLELHSNQLGDKIPGPIPNSLPSLLNLVVLDLSSNRLSGTIPANIALIPHLKHLNLSNNNLSGKIPEPLGSEFDGSVFAMNPSLCGKPLDRECGDVKRRRRNSLFRWRKKLREMIVGEKKRTSPGRASSGGEIWSRKWRKWRAKACYVQQQDYICRGIRSNKTI
ncbi:hypothetical protein M0R45_015932 [Rubus argutus]|uniref:Leucine-rich repeat-containing N-terminal plant-type domain-containing protein n=1 Tax=Rubus argutus TaxID=59490 RepID=A0AAW1XRZ9_RUBAR